MIGCTEKSILSDVADYYSEKLALHGETPKGVDWNGEGSQMLRFEQLCKLVDDHDQFSLNDLGCGYGALHDYLGSRFSGFFYSGFDVSESMIRSAQLRYQGAGNARFVLSSEPHDVADYGVASGIFNVRLGRSEAEWRQHVEATLDILDRTSRIGFSFNCLTSYSDAEKMRDDLFYADPCAVFDLCKRRYSRNVALLHDYGLYEFTILVRKVA